MNLAVAGLALLALFLVIALLAVGGVLLVRVLDDQVPPPRTAWREGYEQEAEHGDR